MRKYSNKQIENKRFVIISQNCLLHLVLKVLYDSLDRLMNFNLNIPMGIGLIEE